MRGGGVEKCSTRQKNATSGNFLSVVPGQGTLAAVLTVRLENLVERETH